MHKLMEKEKQGIVFYGADWCPDCRRAKAFLRRHRVAFEVIDTESDPAAIDRVRELNDGQGIIPTIIINGRVHTNPENDELARVLGLETAREKSVFDVLVIGAGAAGLTAAIYLQRDRFSCVVLERSGVGGNAALTGRIENYPGFRNISGPALMDMMAEQAAGYGAVIETGARVRALVSAAGRFTAQTTTGDFHGRAVVLAVGSDYRTLGVPGEAELIGRGVHYCATCDGPFYRGREVIVIGGGNSALEEGLALARYCRQVTIVSRAPRFTATAVYRDKVAARENVRTLMNRSVVSFRADPRQAKFSALVVSDNETGARSEITADGVFVFIGQRPNTGFLEGFVDLDGRGYVTARGLNATGRPGVFAAGDCRRGALAQVAAATGEGVVAAYGARDWLSGDRNPGETVARKAP